jgi:hypothetical protein
VSTERIPRVTPLNLARRGEIKRVYKKDTETQAFYLRAVPRPTGRCQMGIAWEGRRSTCCHQLGKTVLCFHDVPSSRKHCSAPGYDPPGRFS